MIPALFAAGALLARLVLHASSPHFPVDVAQPLPVATSWGSYGVAAWAVVAIAALAAGAVYLRAVAEPPSLRSTLAAAALTLVIGMFWSPLLSSDVYAYAAYGEMARLHSDPYVHHVMTNDSFVSAAQWQWSGRLPICVYGEAFVAVARAVVTTLRTAGGTIVLDAFRALAAIALLACAVFARYTASDERAGRRAAAFIALNPVALYAALEGHNDTLMVACVLAGFVVARRVPFAAGMLVAGAGAIKVPALAAAAGFTIQRVAERKDVTAAIAGSTAGAILAVAASLRLIEGARAIAAHGTYQPIASVQALSPVLAVALAVAVLARTRATHNDVDRWVLAALALWLVIPNPYPWYALWLVAAAAFARDKRVVATTLAVAAASMLRYLPDAAGALPPAVGLALAITALLAYVPLVV
jgi:hypothetical protein